MFCFKRTRDEIKVFSFNGLVGLDHFKRLEGEFNRSSLHISAIVDTGGDDGVLSYVSKEDNVNETIGEFIDRVTKNGFCDFELTIHTDENRFISFVINHINGVEIVAGALDHKDIVRINDCLGYSLINHNLDGKSISFIFKDEKSLTSTLFCFIKHDEYVDIDTYITGIRQYQGAVRKTFLKSLNRKMISLLLNYFNYNIEHINDPRRVAVFFAHPFDLLSQKGLITRVEYADVLIQYTELVKAVKLVKRK